MLPPTKRATIHLRSCRQPLPRIRSAPLRPIPFTPPPKGRRSVNDARQRSADLRRRPTTTVARRRHATLPMASRDNAPAQSAPWNPAGGVATVGVPHDAPDVSVDVTTPSTPDVSKPPSGVATLGCSALDKRIKRLPAHRLAFGLATPEGATRPRACQRAGDTDGCPPISRHPTQPSASPSRRRSTLPESRCSRCCHR